MYCCRDASMARSRNSGCENATWNPDCTLGSKLLIAASVVVRDEFQEKLQVPAPHGTRCRTPVDENRSPTLAPRSPSSRFTGGVAVFERPRIVEKTGVNAP